MTWKPRHTNGRINWKNPRLKADLHARLLQGHLYSDIARDWGISKTVLEFHANANLLNIPPAHLVLTADAADALNLTVGGVHALLRRRHLPTGRWGKRTTITTEQLEALKDRERIVRERPEGYVTAADLARAWGVTPGRVRVVLKGAPRVAYVGGAARVTFLYDSRQVAHLAPPVAPPTCPAGRMTSKEIAEIVGVKRSHVTGWGSWGCPYIKGRKDRYYNPEEVAAWLLSSSHPHMRYSGRVLQDHIQQRRAA